MVGSKRGQGTRAWHQCASVAPAVWADLRNTEEDRRKLMDEKKKKGQSLDDLMRGPRYSE